MDNKIVDILDALTSERSIIRGFYLTGPAGNSKSYGVYKYFNDHHIPYVKVTARVTNLSLYELLYLNRDAYIIFDDVCFDQDISIDVLKGALNEDGLVSWFSSRDINLPKSFNFKGKIIIITNRGAKDTKLYYPLFSRCFMLEQNLSLEDYKQIAGKMCVERGVDFGKIEGYISVFLKHRDLRVINKAIDFLLSGKDYLISSLFPIDEGLEYIHTLKNSVPALSELEIKDNWCSHFDKSTRTFYRKLKEYNTALSNLGSEPTGL